MTKSEKTICGFIPVFISSILWPSLPQISLIGFALFISLVSIKVQVPAFLVGMLMGFIWASVCASTYMYWQFDSQYYFQNIIIEGEVSSLVATEIAQNSNKLVSPSHTISSVKPINSNKIVEVSHYSAQNKQLKFNFLVNKVGTNNLIFRPKVRLSWFATNLPLQQGDKLRLFVKLKPAMGLANPDGFDYQTWLTSKNIIGTGYVKKSPSNLLLLHDPSLRQQWVNSIKKQNLTHIKWIVALSYGDRSLLEKEDWALMQRTGTAHLFAISGMHLGIVFACVLIFNKLLALVLILVTKRSITHNVKPFLLMVSAPICCGYALIAGFEIPVLRALFTIILWTSLIVLEKYWRTPNALLLLLISFLVFFPFSILGISFWFSFTSVFIIIYYVWRFPYKPHSPYLSKAIYVVKLQLFLSFVTLPIIVYTFSSLPIMAFAANLFMIPVVSFVLVPLCLLAAILLSLSIEFGVLYSLINECFTLTFWVLSKFDNVTNENLGANWQSTPAIEFFMYCLTHPLYLVCLLLLLIPHWPKKTHLLTSIVFIGLFHQSMQTKFAKPNVHWTVYTFDVGQGTAIVLTDKLGTILNDTGGSFAGFSMASSVLMPFFEANQIKNLDYLLISHFDNDHAGGISLLNERLNIETLLSPKQGCNREDFLFSNPSGKGMFLSFTVDILWPLNANSGNENNQSCVIKLQYKKYSILLTGDIEKQAEQRIVELYKGTSKLNANILVAPHHGSQTSSTFDFIKAVAPEFVIFTSGTRNRWGFPSEKVLKRYRKVDAKILITGKHGRIKLDVDNNGIKVSRYRVDEFNRWYYKAR